MASIRPAHQAWSAPAAVTSLGVGVGGPVLRMADDGSVVLGWGTESGGVRIATARDGHWSAPLELGTGPATRLSLDLAADGAGVAVWVSDFALARPPEPRAALMASIRNPGGEWSPPEDLSSVIVWPPIPAISPTLDLEAAVARGGRAVAVVVPPTAGPHPRLLEFRPGTGWSPPKTLGSITAARVSIDINERGEILIGWNAAVPPVLDGFSHGTRMFVLPRTRHGTWSARSRISAPDARRPATAGQVAIDDRGHTFAAWSVPPLGYETDEPPDPPKTAFGAEAATGDAAHGWSAPTRLSRPGDHGGNVSLAVAGRGQAIVGWSDVAGPTGAARVAITR
jgi:hypothetical protein